MGGAFCHRPAFFETICEPPQTVQGRGIDKLKFGELYGRQIKELRRVVESGVGVRGVSGLAVGDFKSEDVDAAGQRRLRYAYRRQKRTGWQQHAPLCCSADISN